MLNDLRLQMFDAADPDRAKKMEAYMKGHFEFLGITAPGRQKTARPFIAATKPWTGDELLDMADLLWAEPQREFQYVATDMLQRRAKRLEPEHLSRLEVLIRTKSWWDTVDTLAANAVGTVVAQNPELASTMDVWIDDDDFWIARTALLHQLKFHEETDERRLFEYVDKRCADTEFFVRKACGWALRQHARLAPEAVREYVESRGDRLSGLTRREALKHL